MTRHWTISLGHWAGLDNPPSQYPWGVSALDLLAPTGVGGACANVPDEVGVDDGCIITIERLPTVQHGLTPRYGISTMSPELGFALLLTLLWGPTALWLAYRALRGHRSRRSELFTVGSETVPIPLRAPGQPEGLASQGFWVCGACRSMNRRKAKHCYSCQTAMGSTGQPAPGVQPVSRMVPVMAEGLARRSGETTRTTAPPAAPGTDLPRLDVLARDPGLVLTAAPHEAVTGAPVCPFLGFRNDPSTRCDFPDPRNLCHAASERGAPSFASPWRFIPGNAGSMRPQEIGASHQKSDCLTAVHERCARHPAAQLVAATR
jgi:hypothetical protein